MTDYKAVTPFIAQIVTHKIGLYCSERMSIDLYYLIEATNLLLEDFGEEEIRKIYSTRKLNFDETKKSMEKLNKFVSIAKGWYDAIQDKKFERRTEELKVQAMFKRNFIKSLRNISLTQKHIYQLFVILVKETTIQGRTIPSESFKVLEHIGFKKIDLTGKKPIESSSSPDVVKNQ